MAARGSHAWCGEPGARAATGRLVDTQNYVTIIDEVYQRVGISNILNFGRRTVRTDHNAKKILIPKISVTNLGDYTRNTGYKTGTITYKFETKTFNYDCDIHLFADVIDVEEAGDTLPISLSANDWVVCGMDVEEIGKLDGASSACLDGYDSSSDFQVGFAAPASYLSPVELLASPWMKEYDESSGVEMVADAHVSASPLSGRCDASLIDTGDYFYDFPSKLARSLCGVMHTDSCRYYDAEGKTRFEYVEFGTACRHDYQALLADKEALMDRLGDSGKIIIWHATVQRDGTNPARERIPGLADRVEKS